MVNIAPEPPDTDAKYVTFKREELFEVLSMYFSGNFVNEEERQRIESAELKDAVVIRRQDLFASPAFATYSACIAIALRTATPEAKVQLQHVADYFQRQSELAADEGWKLPDV